MEGAERFVGREYDLDSFVERLLFSDGGSFLITGYRGVGKTSFINQVIARLKEARDWAEAIEPHTDIQVVDVQLNLARALQPAELMHHIVRRLYETLVELDALPQLPSKLQAELQLAHDRTSFNMTRKLASSLERNLGFPDLGVEAGWGKLTLKGLVSNKRTTSRNDELAFLGYDDRAAEHDVIRLSQLLVRGVPRTSDSGQTWLRRLLGRDRPEQRLRFKLIFVFDELDKLDESPALSTTRNAPVRPDASNGADEGPTPEAVRSAIEDLLSSLKTLFTTSGISFIFVAGKDLQERWQDDVGRGDSVFDSVFSYHKYMP